MKFAVIVSERDPAGMNIKECLLKLYDFKKKDDYYFYKNIELHTVGKESIYCENVDKEIKSDFFVFATKHESTSKINSLSVHTAGNWDKAQFGGRDRELCMAPASYLKAGLLELEKSKIGGFEVIQECTHHGPYIKKPSIFIEIGSSSEQWKSKEAGDVIANTIINVIEKPLTKQNVAFGIGGMHHTPIFKKIILNSDVAMGHICPKYMLQYLDEDMIKQAIDRTSEKVNFVLLDWKGLGKEKKRVLGLLKALDLRVRRSDKILKTKAL